MYYYCEITNTNPNFETETATINSNAAAITVGKISQSAPAKPTLASKTATSITLAEIAGTQYKIGAGDNWVGSPEFSGLTPDTSYNFYARLAGDETHNPSLSSPVSEITTDKATLTGTVTINGTPTYGNTLTAATDSLNSDPSVELGALSYQWKRSNIAIDGATSATYTLVSEDVGKPLTVTVEATNCLGKITSAPTANTAKATPEKPAKPTVNGTPTATTITLNTIDGAEYSKDNGVHWQGSSIFENLTPNTAYTFIAWMKETATHNASQNSEASDTITTERATLSGTISINGTPTYGETLTADTNGLVNTTEAVGAAGIGALSYQWKRSETPIDNATGNTYKLVSADIGQTITVTVSAANCLEDVTSGATTAIKQKPLTFTGTVTATKVYDGDNNFSNTQITIDADSFIGIVSEDAVSLNKADVTGTLESANVGSGPLALSGNFTLTGTNAENYTLSGQPAVTATITQATPQEIKWPTAKAITYGATLSTSLLENGEGDGNFTWTAPDTIPNVSNSGYEVTFTPNDAVNYDYVGITLTKITAIKVNEATGTFAVPAALSAIYSPTLTLAGIPLPDNYVWVNSETAVSAGDGQTFTATFTNPSGNYLPANGDVTVNVAKATPIINTAPTAANIYKGDLLSDSDLSDGQGSVDGTFEWANGTATPDETKPFDVTFKPIDEIAENYNTASTSVTVTVLDRNILNEVIILANEAKDSAEVGDAHGQYTADRIEEFATRITLAQIVYDTAAATNTQEAINTATTILQAETELFVKTPNDVNADGLLAVIKTVKDKMSGATYGDRNGDYDPEQETILGKAIDEAQTIADKSDRTPDEVSQAISDLQTAITNFDVTLVTVVYDNLSDLIELCNFLYNNAVEGDGDGHYEPGSMAIFKAAIEAAKPIATNNRATQAEINEAEQALQEAQNTFAAKIIGVNRDVLGGLIEQAQEKAYAAVPGDRNGDYPETAIADLAMAAETALTTVNAINVTQEALDEAASVLHLAIEAFNAAKIIVDYLPIKDLLDVANNAKELASEGEGNGQHAAASMSALQLAIDTAQLIADDDHLSQNTVNAAQDSLKQAYDEFIESIIVVDFDALDAKIAEAKLINRGSYTADTWNALQTAIAGAETVRGTQHVTQVAVGNALTALNSAIDGLRYYPIGDGGNNNSNSSGNSSGNGDNSSSANTATTSPVAIPGGGTVTTPVGKSPVKNQDGSTSLPGGGTVSMPGGVKADVPAGSSISADGTVTVGENGGTVDSGGSTAKVPEGSTIDADGNTTVGKGGGDVAMPGGVDVTVLEGTVIDSNGKTTVGKGGGNVSTPKGAAVTVPEGSVVTPGGSISFPQGSGGGSVTLKSGFIFNLPENIFIIFDEDAPLSYRVGANNPFSDVRQGDWFYDDAMFAYGHGLMNGTSETLFSPNAPMTRAMAVTVLFRMDNPAKGADTTDFADVPLYQWYSDAIAWAAQNGIVLGYDETSFGPDDLITRQDMAVILLRYADYKRLKLPAMRTYLAFADDAGVSGYARAAVAAMYNAGVIDGKPENRLDPAGLTTRVEGAAMLRRLLGVVSG
jgi:hypothetical protein